VTIKLAPSKGIKVSSTVITGMEGEGDKKVKDEESRDL
jgi:biotin synthase-like enzyme